MKPDIINCAKTILNEIRSEKNIAEYIAILHQSKIIDDQLASEWSVEMGIRWPYRLI